MALWGNDDLVSSGTGGGSSAGATITGTTALALGASATTTNAIKVGHWIRITVSADTYEWALIKAIASATSMTLDRALTNVSDVSFQVFSAPKFLGIGWPAGPSPLLNAKEALGENNATSWMYGVDNTEMAAARADIAGPGDANNVPHHTGWVARIDRGSSRKPRYRYETLVAMGSMTNAAGDFEDEDFKDS